MNKKCQVFTPKDYVEELLDSINYTHDLYGKKFLENSCGDGNILVVAVQRYIDDCKLKGLSRTKIKNGLSRDIFGIEIDKYQYQKCVKNLNKILEINNIKDVDWQIANDNYLKWNTTVKFKFIAGNPPYITYTELSKDEQSFVRNNYYTCEKGKFDYCYAFIEKSIKSLDEDGEMSYLIPSSIFKTVFGWNLRAFMKPYLYEIKDYTQEKLFDDALVKSSIITLKKELFRESFSYIDMTTGETSDILIDNLEDKWFFSNNRTDGIHRFGDYFKTSHVVATLLNKVFVIDADELEEHDEYYKYRKYKIEKSILRPTATPRSLRYEKEQKIIFPYRYINNELVRYSEDEFLKVYPYTFEYMNDNRILLEKRDRDNSAQWYEYGRSQALANLNCTKLLISTVITDRVVVYNLEPDYIPYAGMYIVKTDSNVTYDLHDAMTILQSEAFMNYVKDVGIRISGSSLRITSKDISNFRFTEA